MLGGIDLTKESLVAHAAIYSVDNRILAEAGQRPKNGLLGETEGVYQTKITRLSRFSTAHASSASTSARTMRPMPLRV